MADGDLDINAIDVLNLDKYYGKFKALDDVTFSVKQGEIFGFIGPNGSGKSTTIRTILSLLTFKEGQVKILGEDVASNGHKIREKVGYLPAEVNYYAKMTSKELLNYHGRFYPTSNFKLIDELAERFELDINKRFSDLSSGNKKKCAIIQSLLHEPDLLILDEPTSGLDPLMQNRFFTLLEELNDKGVTVFFSSHILKEIQRLCDRAAIIRKGKITALEEIKDLLAKQMKLCNLTLKSPTTEIKFPEGARNAANHQGKVSFEYLGDVNGLTKWLEQQDLRDVVISEPDLESIFMNYYE